MLNNIRYLDTSDMYPTKLVSYAISRDPFKVADTALFEAIHKEIERFLGISDIETIEVFMDYRLRIVIQYNYTLYLNKGVLKICDFRKEVSRVVQDESLATRFNKVAVELLHSLLSHSHPDAIAQDLKKKFKDFDSPLPVPGLHQRLFY